MTGRPQTYCSTLLAVVALAWTLSGGFPSAAVARPAKTSPVVAVAADVAISAASATWVPQPRWCANPSRSSQAAHAADKQIALFRVAEPGKEMKWSSALPQPASLAGFRWLSLRYRATRLSGEADYAVCLLGHSPAPVQIIRAAELIRDGRWHVINADLRTIAGKMAEADQLAVQVRAAASDATLEISDMRLTNTLAPRRLADEVDCRSGADFREFKAVDLSPWACSDSAAWQSDLQLDHWFVGRNVTIHGIPVALTAGGRDVAATKMTETAYLRFPVVARVTEVYLLLAAHMVGPEEAAYGGGPLHAIEDVDRFRVRLQYADGTADDCLPMNVATKQFGVRDGVQMLVAAADPSKRLDTLMVRDLCKQAAFGIVAMSYRTAGDRLYPEALQESPPLKVARSPAQASPWDYLGSKTPPIEICVGGKAISSDDLLPLAAKPEGAGRRSVEYRVRGIEGLRLGVDLKNEGPAGLCVRVSVRNDGREQRTVELTAPMIGPYRLGANAEDAFYLLPKRGAMFDNRDGSYRKRYCGEFPLQFVDTFNPKSGRGLTLRTLDTRAVRKEYILEKQAGQFRVGVAYPHIVLKPGERFETPSAVVEATDGDWHRGLDSYRKWLSTWHRPQTPRKQWFREVFNFRQRFLWQFDPLYDARNGQFHLQRAVDEARREFGGIDYLHLFDWGDCPPYGRVYGRTGDYAPYETFRGGRESLRQAIAQVQAQGIPVGLYIEGYLLSQHGKLGQQFGPRWQLIGADGKGGVWPDSGELCICPAISAWRDIQASTYVARVKELGVDGMYIDQFGFGQQWHDCCSKEHGHGVPSYAVTAERDCTRIISDRVAAAKSGVVVYTEESPVDVTTQSQDGSFTYAMNQARESATPAPLNLMRFAIPDFKTFEILCCDKPTGSWATGVKWVFFNGEGLWLELPGQTHFEPETRATIRRCYAILRKHRDAFTTLRPVPLVPTEKGGVYANSFPATAKTVYTLYNSRNRTVRGEVLRIAGADHVTCFDEWNQRPASVRRDGADLIVSLEIGPHDVGCLVVYPR
ncbi:MAG: DUF6259 domain-containing protein [Planctomycetaceae bacterium]|nr:DUF6259 domain-containing protein [Planctomycetaceae bacterium]